jgi:hypothetical protein
MSFSKSQISYSIILVCCLYRLAIAADNNQPIPLTHVHAHNDYEHVHPLFDAMDCGICSFEGDINLVDGELLIAHSRSAVKAGVTLQSLYLDPMRKRIKENGGRIYRNGPPVWLLIDFKSNPHDTYPVLRKILQQYTDILSTWENGKMKQGAVTAILTGDHPDEEIVAAEPIRYAAIDGKIDALDRNPPASLVPWMSSQWSISFKWRGRGEIPESEREKLKKIVEKAHQQGRLVRFWGAPDNSTTWGELQKNNVDLLNTDDLRGVQKFLLAHPYPAIDAAAAQK